MIYLTSHYRKIVRLIGSDYDRRCPVATEGPDLGGWVGQGNSSDIVGWRRACLMPLLHARASASDVLKGELVGVNGVRAYRLSAGQSA